MRWASSEARHSFARRHLHSELGDDGLPQVLWKEVTSLIDRLHEYLMDIHRISLRCLENRLAVLNICLPSSFVIPLKA